MTIFFLPGAGGSASFWRAVSEKLDLDEDRHFFAWPGLGNEPQEPDVRSLDDLVSRVLDALATVPGPSVLIAQSMGGYVAMRAALAAPHLVRSLVLAVTSAGVPTGQLGASDWRAAYQASFPQAATWIADPTPDLSERIPNVTAPCLLLWGDADPISPVAVGERLRSLLPDARLHVFAGADHDLAITHVAEVSALIRAHLQKGTTVATE